jgi:putative transposase
MSTIGRIRGKAPGRSIPGYSLNKNNKKVSDEQIKEYIIQIIEDEGYAYGYLKITHALRRNFHLLINKKKVYRLCKELNLLKSQRKIKTKHPRRIARNRVVTGSNQLWQTDVKYGYVAGEGRFFYILSIIDVADRSIIAFHMGLRCTSEDAVTTLKKRQLYNTDSIPILRSDNGPQYISHIFGDACKKLGVEHERIPYKTPNMNAYIESYHSILEDECLGITEFESYASAYKEVHEFVRRYNTKRIHSGAKYMPPSEYFQYLQVSNEKLSISL